MRSWHLLFSLFLVVSLNALESDKDDISLRQKHRKNTKVKLAAPGHFSSYGVELPAFSFDYSELIASATIEKSQIADELLLTIVLVGHRAVFDDFAFETISTEEEVLHKWGEAVKRWSARRADIKHHSHHPLMCVMHNNEQRHTPPYQSHAMRVSSDQLPDNLKGTFDVWRCKIRGSSVALEKLAVEGGHLSVDLVRKVPHARHIVNGTHGTIISEVIAQNASSPSPPPDAAGAIISFFVPWKTRTAGFGLDRQTFSTYLDAWHGLEAGHATNHSSAGGYAISLDDRSMVNARPHPSPVEKRIFLCASDFRSFPVSTTFHSTPIANLLDFLAYNYNLGVKHIILGLQLDWKSVRMRAHLAVLQRFIEQGLLTVVSTSLPGHDHVAGFAGMHLHEEYAELFFMNQCSSFLKGLADVVVFSRVDSLIAPVQHGRLSNILDLSTSPSPRNSSDAAASVSGVGSRASTGHLRAWKPGSIHASPVRSMFGDDSLKVYTVTSLMSANQSRQIIAVQNMDNLCMISRVAFTPCIVPMIHLHPSDTVDLVALRVERLKARTAAIAALFKHLPIGTAIMLSSPANRTADVIIDHYPIDTHTESVKAALSLTAALRLNSTLLLRNHNLETKVQISKLSAEVLWTATSEDYLPSGPLALKKPFWLRCDTHSLSDVLKTVFKFAA